MSQGKASSLFLISSLISHALKSAYVWYGTIKNRQLLFSVWVLTSWTVSCLLQSGTTFKRNDSYIKIKLFWVSSQEFRATSDCDQHIFSILPSHSRWLKSREFYWEQQKNAEEYCPARVVSSVVGNFSRALGQWKKLWNMTTQCGLFVFQLVPLSSKEMWWTGNFYVPVSTTKYHLLLFVSALLPAVLKIMSQPF